MKAYINKKNQIVVEAETRAEGLAMERIYELARAKGASPVVADMSCLTEDDALPTPPKGGTGEVKPRSR